jgi:hypothetical protein
MSRNSLTKDSLRVSGAWWWACGSKPTGAVVAVVTAGTVFRELPHAVQNCLSAVIGLPQFPQKTVSMISGLASISFMVAPYTTYHKEACLNG